jgi:undecaprenyl diphosphate synthase
MMKAGIMQNLESTKEHAAGDEYLLRQIDPARLPAHVAIIMDGNGRWAARRKLPRVAGHRAGAEAVRRTVETAARLGLGCLTLFAFSTENWKRPRAEVEALMRLLREFLRKELASLQKNNIRFQTVGRREGLPGVVLKEILNAELATSKNTGLCLNIALNYGGRSEIIDACRQIAQEVARGQLKLEEIDDQKISARLYTRSLPDPDLLIRTSGEMRVSNFLLWQIAYAEIYVTETLWPDFDTSEFFTALVEYQKRERRYGAVKQLQLVPKSP